MLYTFYRIRENSRFSEPSLYVINKNCMVQAAIAWSPRDGGCVSRDVEYSHIKRGGNHICGARETGKRWWDDEYMECARL